MFTTAAPRFFHGRAKLRQILRIGGRKVSGPGLDLIDLELLDYVGGEVFQVHGLRGFAVLSRDELAEGIGGDGDAFSRLRRKLQVGSGTGVGQGRGEPHSGRGGRASLQKSSSSRWRQAGQSSTVVLGFSLALGTRARAPAPHKPLSVYY